MQGLTGRDMMMLQLFSWVGKLLSIFYFAIAAIVLLGLSWILTDRFKGKDGTPEGGMGCVVGLINSAMIICAICSFYLLVPIGIVYFLLKGNKKK